MAAKPIAKQIECIMSAVDSFLSHLTGVKKIGRDRWIACCPSHDDNHPSLHVREMDSGQIVMICRAGCGNADIVASVGLRFDALYPERPIDGHFLPKVRKPFYASDVLQISAHEATVVFLVATSIANGTPLSEVDRARLLVAASRLNHAVEVANNGY